MRVGLIGLGFMGSDRKVGAFGYYTGKLVDVVKNEFEVEAFFEENPNSLLVAVEGKATRLFASKRADWRARVVHEFTAASQLYYVFRGS